ncbi:hypothetical protein A3F38_00105 [Candidatus Saccharibacteria bacterium RIFCSPHIGHO2_12_FULL_48_21]|nr:MAG: hypothetical protein A3F38_00105 [Candidatus Saccharibacteria bacterium RIFCSPHIGHO2_12_FULL_48_21]
MDNEVAVSVASISKSFKLPHESYRSVKSLFVNFYRRKRTYELHQALKDVSFEVKKGEFFGIIGRNGSGKSTLLKIMAGIYAPSRGTVVVNGSLTPFIELGVGFNPELTGRENVFLNGALLGFNRREMLKMYNDIVEFAEIEKFMDQKLKNYSSGMQVRLAFSIAIRAHSDILLLDEVLAVGDTAFQQKCYDYFSELKKAGKTIILVSHNMSIIENFCDHVILIDAGVIKHIGDGREIATKYEQMFIREEKQKFITASDSRDSNQSSVKILSLKTRQDGKITDDIVTGKNFEIELVLNAKTEIQIADVGISINNRDKNTIIAANTKFKIGNLQFVKDTKKIIKFNIQNPLTNGVYTINVAVSDYSSAVPKVIVKKEGVVSFTVRGATLNTKALVQPDISIKTN